MKTIHIQYVGPLPEVQVEIVKGKPMEAKRHGDSIPVSEDVGRELLERHLPLDPEERKKLVKPPPAEWIEVKPARNGKPA